MLASRAREDAEADLADEVGDFLELELNNATGREGLVAFAVSFGSFRRGRAMFYVNVQRHSGCQKPEVPTGCSPPSRRPAQVQLLVSCLITPDMLSRNALRSARFATRVRWLDSFAQATLGRCRALPARMLKECFTAPNRTSLSSKCEISPFMNTSQSVC